MKKHAVLTTAALFAATVMFAQHGPGGPGRGGPGFGGFGGFGHGGPPVTGLPYSASFTRTSTQTLADGNTITHTTTGQVARDAAGDTYLQETFSNVGPWSTGGGSKTVIFVTNVAAGLAYEIFPETKTYTQHPLRTRSLDGAAHTNGFTKAADPNVVVTGPTPQTFAGVAGDGTAVAVDSTVSTRTIPAGKFGNAQPIVSTTTVWKATTLGIVVYENRVDPRSGTQTYALSNLSTVTPPAASLFTVPAGYTLKADGHGLPLHF